MKSNRLYGVISQINHLVIHCKNREDVFSGACHIAVEHGQWCMAWIGLINPETKRLVPVAWAGHEDGYLKSITPISISDIPEGQGPTGSAIREGRPVVLNNIDEPQFAPWRKEAIKRDYASSVALPIKIDDEVVGAFSLYSSTPAFFKQEEVDLLEEMTGNISFALESLAKENQRRKNELLIAKSEHNFRTIFEKAPFGVAVIDSENGLIYDLNQSYAKITGRTIKELQQRTWIEITHPDDVQVCLDNLSNLNSERINGLEMNTRYVHPDGKIVWVSMSVVPFDINVNGRRRHLCMVADITEKKMIEEDLYAALRMRDDFLMVASHELKTPLTTLQVLLHSVHKIAVKDMSPSCSEIVLPKLIKAEKQSDRLDQLIRNLLDVSQMSAERFKLNVVNGTDLSKLVRDLVSKFEEDFQKEGIVIDANISPGLTGDWDSLRVEQVLINLLTNAKKYGGGKKIDLLLKRKDTYARIEVRDKGIGIPKEKQSLIFERFERAVDEHSYKGLGIGLWIVKQIVEAHHGRIWVESKVNEGSNFIVELPLTCI